jgi:hypothetical protein
MKSFVVGSMVEISGEPKELCASVPRLSRTFVHTKGKILCTANLLFITNQSNSIMVDHVVPLSNDELHTVCKIDWISNRIRVADFEVEAGSAGVLIQRGLHQRQPDHRLRRGDDSSDRVICTGGRQQRRCFSLISLSSDSTSSLVCFVD